jgi:SMC interacting uncharacterized protein involved in chromosome segregation
MQFTVDLGTLLVPVGLGLTGLVWALLRESIRSGDVRVLERVNDRFKEFESQLVRLERDHSNQADVIKAFQATLHTIELQLASINSKLERAFPRQVALAGYKDHREIDI